ncbi:glycerophosphodiester phosphodiesterase family protein [Agrilactobacillus fermenti]|uniref:glycerophosphodiester phosphodiesterase family protein n=1 Tax=Agrilactobacillus fermenti TaxID=2586909 RepID=UPI003A5B9E81
MTTRKIIAHRGLPTLAPENTQRTFNKLLDYNIDWFETDLSITKDAQAVILHDDNLERTTDTTGLITEKTTAELTEVSNGAWFSPEFAQERILTLIQLIDFLNQNKLNVNIELKSVIGTFANDLANELVSQLVQALKLLDTQINVIVSSFNPLMIAKFKALDTTTPTALLFSQNSLQADWDFYMQALDTKIIHPQSEGLTKEKVQTIKDHGYDLNVWTVDRIDRANQLFNWGVDGVITNIAQNMPQIQAKTPRSQKTQPLGPFLSNWH